MKSYKDLNIWQRSIKVVEEIYKITKNFPKEEIYGLTSQLRRSAVSIPSNIAEGFARLSNKEYKQFLFISLGSCSELSTQIIIALRLEYLKSKEADQLLNEIDEISKMTMSLIKKLDTS
ncbi:MAG: four helix bundle protein [Actinobacteria bacterium RBG_13_35_12]|uniref:Four helix bundle protein n=1 Tax=Candidatus Sediminicultor quintus TaxID=1797291 RepID=A0A1F5A4H0_9BACT|nr:MAG: four helix bundle protein [Actinobacteria bacterium RBG_13_35_12]OGD13459.1 MAG: four helix bundle protein [Candidatus Atribacteria bacterium RBG_19FT_COMBO_35_14]